MSKKVILGTLLASATLLGTSSADAATSSLKSEHKKVTVSTDKAKLYKDSKLQSSTTPKKGTVYEVDGYRIIDGKHYYRVYQNNADKKKTYKGYLVNTQAKDLTMSKASAKYIVKDNATMWNDFYWNNKRSKLSDEKVYYTKGSYTLGNGDKYFSMYYKDSAGKEKWAGYTNAVNTKVLKATEYKKIVSLKKDYTTWQDLHFQDKRTTYKADKGVNFTAERYYTIGGKKFYSLTDGSGKWAGYANASYFQNLSSKKVELKKVTPAKSGNLYKNHFYSKKASLNSYNGETLVYDLVYTYGNGRQYASLYTMNKDGEKDKWVGYANMSLLKDAPKVEKPESSEDTTKPSNKPESSEDTTKPSETKDTVASSSSIEDSIDNTATSSSVSEGQESSTSSTESTEESVSSSDVESSVDNTESSSTSSSDKEDTSSTSSSSTEEDKQTALEEMQKKFDKIVEEFYGVQDEINYTSMLNRIMGYAYDVMASKDEETAAQMNEVLDKILADFKAEQEDSNNTPDGEIKTNISNTSNLKASAQQLSKVIIDVKDSGVDGGFTNLSEAKALATTILKGASEVDKYSNGDESKNIQPLVNNLAWTKFSGNVTTSASGDYLDALKLLQKYAKDTSSVSASELSKINQALKDDMDKMEVVTSDLKDSMDEIVDLFAKHNIKLESKSQSNFEAQYKEAEQILSSADQRGLEKWKDINKLTVSMKQYLNDIKAELNKQTTITNDKTTLENPALLSRAILSSNKSDKAAKDLANVVSAAYKVEKYGEGNEEQSVAGIENNLSWTRFGGQGQGSYYDAYKTLQNYARNTTSVTEKQLVSSREDLIYDMEGLRVLTTELKEVMIKAESLTQKDTTVESLIKEAKLIVDSKTDARRGLDNWEHINELTKKLKDANTK